MLTAGALLLFASLSARVDTPINKPFMLVSLWSDEMMDYLTGAKQIACSGANVDAPKCRRLASGVCDGTAYFKFLSDKTLDLHGPGRGLPAKQTESVTPQAFELELSGGGYNSISDVYDFAVSQFDRLEMVFNCSFSSDNGGCRLPPRKLDTPQVTLNEHTVYTLSKTITTRRASDGAAVQFASGANIVIVAIRDRALEIRREQPYDMPCTEEEQKAPRRNVPTYLIDAAKFYDRDLHLQLRPAYPKGC